MAKFLFNKVLVILLISLVSNAFSSVEHSAHTIKIKDGELYYESFGSGTPIIALHGGPGLDHTYLLPQLEQLAKHHKVIFYDQRGSGKSLKTPFNLQNINMPQFVDDLEQLRISLGINQFILLGHSFGGLLAMHYSVQHPNHLQGLILVSSAPATEKGETEFLNEFNKRTKPISQSIQALFSWDKFKQLNADQINAIYRKTFSVYFYYPKNLDKLNLALTEEGAKGGFKVNALFNQAPKKELFGDLLQRLNKLTTPTLILHCKQDIVPIPIAKRLHHAIPNSQLIVLNHCGHFPYIEKPDLFFHSINSFTHKLKK